MCVRTYVCMYVYVYMCVRIYMCMYMCVRIYTYVYIALLLLLYYCYCYYYYTPFHHSLDYLSSCVLQYATEPSVGPQYLHNWTIYRYTDLSPQNACTGQLCGSAICKHFASKLWLKLTLTLIWKGFYRRRQDYKMVRWRFKLWDPVEQFSASLASSKKE
jgi:hypothetical protein